MLDSRSSPRALTLRTAQILGDGSAEPIACAILDITNDGICVLVADAVAVPDRFFLRVDHDGWSRPCAVVWRKHHRIGVQFPRAAASTSASTPRITQKIMD